MSHPKKNLKEKYASDLDKALGHLDYSYKKVQRFSFDGHEWSENDLEVLESFSSRFARSSDIAINRYLRALCVESDPAFRGSVIDILNLSEKLGYILDARLWVRIRELRNVAAHEYASEDLDALYQELIRLAPTVLSIRSKT